MPRRCGVFYWRDALELRDYQLKVIEEYENAVAAGQKRLLLVAPTGSGKTIIAAEIVHRAIARHHRVLVISHRREIIQQTGDKLNGVDHGIIQAGLEKHLDLYKPVQVASIMTLWSRAIR